MCYSNSSTSKNVDLSKKYEKKVPTGMDETPIYFASGFSFPTWRIVTKNESLESMKWGLIPAWYNGNDPKEIASMTLNAKTETLEEKASFKSLVHRQECIVPSNGFYEWQTIGKEKIPFFIQPSKEPLFSMAGLFDHWIDPISGIQHKTFTILTCPANDLMAEIHNSKKRMPVLLTPNQENDWLQGTIDPQLFEIPVDSSFLKAHEINRKIVSGKQANCPEVQHPFKNEFFQQGSLF